MPTFYSFFIYEVVVYIYFLKLGSMLIDCLASCDVLVDEGNRNLITIKPV